MQIIIKRYEHGGPDRETGLTGRKLVSCLSGGWFSVGNAEMSGRNPSKIEKLSTLYSRYIAKSLVSNGLCHRA